MMRRSPIERRGCRDVLAAFNRLRFAAELFRGFDRIAIPSTAVTYIAHQRISPFRTGLAIGTGVGAMLAVVFSVGQLLGTSGPGRGGGGELP